VQPYVMPNALELDRQARATFPGLLIHGGIAPPSLTSEQIGTPENRWNGGNRGGWSHPEYDRLWERYNSTLDRGEQVQALVGMMKLHSEQVPNYPLNYSLNVVAHIAALKGPEGDFSHWNIHEWELAP
jgi:ABC-type transport system substrate-binding protein